MNHCCDKLLSDKPAGTNTSTLCNAYTLNLDFKTFLVPELTFQLLSKLTKLTLKTLPVLQLTLRLLSMLKCQLILCALQLIIDLLLMIIFQTDTSTSFNACLLSVLKLVLKFLSMLTLQLTLQPTLQCLS